MREILVYIIGSVFFLTLIIGIVTLFTAIAKIIEEFIFHNYDDNE